MRFNLPFHVHLGRRTRLVMRYAGFALFSLMLFLFALQLAFPYDRLRDRAIDALAASYEVQISEVERGLIPGRVYFHGVSIRGRPKKADEVVTPLFIRELKVDASLLALLRRAASVDFDASIGDSKNGVGHVAGTITLPKFGSAGIDLDIEGKEVPGASLPLRSVLGLPIVGKIDFAFRLGLPTIKKANRNVYDWRKADGAVDLSCPSRCTIGDGRTRLKPLVQDRNNQAMVADGIDFGKLDVESLVAHAVFTPEVGNADARSSSYKPGKFEIEKFDIKSPDGELHVDYAMTMAQEFGDSMVTGCLRYKANERLLQKEETKRTYAAISTIGAELRSDGLFHIRLTERFKEMRRLNQECGPNQKTANGGPGRGAGPRPGLGGADGPPARPSIAPPTTPEAPPVGGGVPTTPAPAASHVPQPGVMPSSATPGGSPPGSAIPSGMPAPGSATPSVAPTPTTDGMPMSPAAPATAPPSSPNPPATPDPSGMPVTPSVPVQGDRSPVPDTPMR